TIFIGGTLWGYVYGQYQMLKMYGTPALKNPIVGLYEIESFSANGTERPPLLTDATRWRRVNITRYNRLVVRMMNDSVQYYQFTDNPQIHTITWTGFGATTQPAITFQYVQSDSDHMTLEGDFGGEKISVQMKKVPDSSYELVSRGFNWINETP